MSCILTVRWRMCSSCLMCGMLGVLSRPSLVDGSLVHCNALWISSIVLSEGYMEHNSRDVLNVQMSSSMSVTDLRFSSYFHLHLISCHAMAEQVSAADEKPYSSGTDQNTALRGSTLALRQ
jgi:hypothetical protein